MKLVSANEAELFFPAPWMERIRQPSIRQRTHCCLLPGKESGCTVTQFDGMNTLWNLWTPPALRNNGHAQRLVKEVAEFFSPQLVLAHYRIDELNIAKLFEKAGFEVIHRGADKFHIVASRTV